MEVWALQLFNGLSLSSIMLLIALGLALSFGLMNVINLAHGEFIMLGAYTVYALQQVAERLTGAFPPARLSSLRYLSPLRWPPVWGCWWRPA